MNIPVKKISQQELDYELGEKYAAESQRLGRLAAEHLFRAQWGYGEPEWYDHRLHFLDPERHQTDFWAMSADNVIKVLPLGGELLDLCSGDGWYDRWFYALRANVMAIEKNKEAYDFAVKHHSHPRVRYNLADIMECELFPDQFDVVLIRGAIEHFTENQQFQIIRKAYDVLKPGGYFCGDTPASRGDSMLKAHEHEWSDETEAGVMMADSFELKNIETWSLESETVLHDNDIGKRTTLYWRCRK